MTRGEDKVERGDAEKETYACETDGGFDNIGALVHHDDRASPEARLRVLRES